MPLPDAARWRRGALFVGLAYAAAAAVVVTLHGMDAARELGANTWSLMPTGGDAADYDNIALCIAQGKGFANDWQDPAYRHTYEKLLSLDPSHPPEVLSRTGGVRPTAFRPPLYPAILGLQYYLFGRAWVIPRILNCLLLGLTAALLFLTSTNATGSMRFGLLAVALLATNARVWFYTPGIETETMGVATATLAVSALASALSASTSRTMCGAGLSLSAAILTRTAFVFFAPFFFLAILRHGAERKARRLAHAAVYTASCLLPISIWSLRTSLVMGHVVLLGTQGGVGLPCFYTQECLNAHGFWVREDHQPFWQELKEAGETGGEWGMDRKGKEIFLRLVRENPRLIPRLVAVKLWGMLPVPLRTRSNVKEFADAFLFYLAVVFLFFCKNRAVRAAALAPVLGTFLMAAVTYQHPRFRVAMIPSLALLAAIGIHGFLTRRRDN